MSSLASLLLGQAAPSGSAISGLSPEAQEALRALNGQSGVPEQTMPATPPPPPAQTMPAQGAAPAEQGMLARLLTGLSNLFMGGTSAKELAGPQPTPAPLTPEELAKRREEIARRTGQAQ